MIGNLEPDRLRAGGDRAATPTGTTTRPSTRRAAMELVVPARISAAARERVRGAGAVEAFGRSGCRGLARVDFFVDGDDGAGQRAQHDAGLHAHQRVRPPVRRLGSALRRAARPPASATRSSATARERPHTAAAMTAAPDFEAEGLLDGLDDPRRRQARLELLEELHADGVSGRGAAPRGGRAAADDPAGRAGAGGAAASTPPTTSRARPGVDAEWLARSWQALGMPRRRWTRRLHRRRPRERAGAPRALRDAAIADEPRAGAAARAWAGRAAQIAEALRDLVGEALRPAGRHRARSRPALRRLQPARSGPSSGRRCSTWSTCTCASTCAAPTSPARSWRAAASSGSTREVAVAFADMVGFTRLGASVPAGELGVVADRLAEPGGRGGRSRRCASSRRSATRRCSCATDTAALLDATLALVEAAEARGRGLPDRSRPARPAGRRSTAAGDWYGHTVNLASRVTGIARPGGRAVTEDVRDAADGATAGRTPASAS